MPSTYFPSQATLKERLKERFPVQAPDTSAAKQAVTDAKDGSWKDEADIKLRKADIQRALRHLESNVDNEVEYLRGAVDLQINKASALRTYSSILVAVAVFSTQLPNLAAFTHFLLMGTIALAVVSALLTISTSWTSWPEKEHFRTAEKECDWLVLLLVRRGCRVNLAVICTIAATLAWAAAFAPIAIDRYKVNAEVADKKSEPVKQEKKSEVEQSPPPSSPGVVAQPEPK